MGETDDPIQITQGEYSMLVLDLEDARAELAAARAELEVVREAARRAADRGLMIFHVSKQHVGLARHCQELSCRLERRDMARILDHGAGEQRAAAAPSGAGEDVTDA